MATVLAKYFIVVCLTSLTGASSGGLLEKFVNVQADNELEVIAKCTWRIAKRHFKLGNRIQVICKDCGFTVNRVVRSLSEHDSIVVSESYVKFYHEREPSYIVFDFQQLPYIRDKFLRPWLERDFSRNNEYLLVTKATNEELYELATLFWHYKFRNIIYLQTGPENWGEIIQPKKMNDRIELVPLQNCQRIHSAKEIPSLNVEVCPLGSCNMTFTLIFGVMMKFWSEEDGLWVNNRSYFPSVGRMVVKKFGDLTNISIHELEGGVPWSNITDMIERNEVDIAHGTVPPSMDLLKGMEIVGAYGGRTMVIALRVQAHLTEDNFLGLLMPFHYFVWICAFFLMLVYFFLLLAIKTLWERGLMSERLTCLQMYGVVVSLNVNQPKKVALRFIFGLWLVWSFQMNLAYNSTFSSSLTTTGDEDRLKTFQNLRDSVLDIKGPEMVYRFMRTSKDPVLMELCDRYEIMPPTQAINAMLNGKSGAVIQQMTVDRMNWVHRADPALVIYTLRERPFYLPALMYVKKGNPFADRLHNVISLGRDTGLIQKWRRQRGIHVIDDIKIEMPIEDGILNMDHLRIAFTIYGIIIGISWLLFFLEFFHLDRKIRERVVGERSP